MNSQHQEFWNKQISSLNRPLTQSELSEKATEHALIMSPEDRIAESIDLGCGAGEFLNILLSQVNIRVGLDFSDSLLQMANDLIHKRDNIKLINADIFTYLPSSRFPVWITTGALNQYLNVDELERVIEVFQKNSVSRSFYVFDTVDFLRYKLLPFGIAYRHYSSHLGATYSLRRTLLRAKFLFDLCGKESFRFPSVGMGFGYLPSFWIRNAKKFNLKVQIFSSRFYEYRYHVILQK